MKLAYVYKITDIRTNEFYIGVRCGAKNIRSPEEDFLIHYFSSGKLKNQLKENKQFFKGEIIFRSNETVLNSTTKNEEYVVYWYEQLLIKESRNNSLCLNRHYIDPDDYHHAFLNFSCSEETKQRMRKPKPTGFGLKVSKSLKGKSLSDSTKNKIRNHNLGKTQSIETKLKRIKTISELVWINNGVTNKRIKKHLIQNFFNEGWKNGRVGKSNQY